MSIMNALVTTSFGRASLLLIAALAATLVFALYLCLIALAEPLLTVRDAFARSDFIVVLGGDGPPRAAKAAELWLAGMAPRVLVSGDGDCLYIRDAMIAAGVAGTAITIECRSGSTRENAELSAPILAQANVTSATLVTSWFHSRRALASFEKACPRIVWRSYPTDSPHRFLNAAFSHHGPAIAQEYAKSAVYALGDLARGIQGTDKPAGWCAGEPA